MLHHHDDDTIAAIATASGEGGIGIIRISGTEALSIAGKLFRSASAQPAAFETHRLYYGHIIDPRSGEHVDEVLLGVMRAPRSYTRQDVIEINCHGGAVSLERVLNLVLQAGARPADPGEFTKRAFLNGRLDLSQAEAALDLIRARSGRAARMALSQLEGQLSQRINALREVLLTLCAHVESYIDFPDEDIEPSTQREMLAQMDEVIQEIAALVATYDNGRLYRDGVRTAIVGKPNVGKSSLLNALSMSERAIVTEQPGTTRDVIEEHIIIHGLPLLIMDTAGIRQSHDMVEQEGVRRSLRAIEQADLVLAVFDMSRPLSDEDREVLRRIKTCHALVVLNKSDKASAADFSELERYGSCAPCRVSAKAGEGLEELRIAIHSRLVKQSPGSGDTEGMMVTNLRHRGALTMSKEALIRAREALSTSAPGELVAVDLRLSLDFLGEIVGIVSTDDILNKIFADFCIGK